MEGREYKGNPGQVYVPLWRWIGERFVNIILSTIIFFLAALLCVMTWMPGLYGTEAEIYIAAEDGDTKVTAAALGEYQRGNGSRGITDGLYGFRDVPAGLRFRTEYDMGTGTVRVRSVSSDPYSAFDTVKRAIDVSRKYLEGKDAADAMLIVKAPEIAKHRAYSIMVMPALAAAVLGFVLTFFIVVIWHKRYKSVYRRNAGRIVPSYAGLSGEKARETAKPEPDDYAELSVPYEVVVDPDEETLKKLLSSLEDAGYGSGQMEGGE